MRHMRTSILVICALMATPAAFALQVANGEATGLDAARVVAGQSVVTDLRMAQSDGMTLNQAVEQVRRQYNGRIVSAETKRSGNREVHHIKVLTEDGKVKTVRIQGRSLGGKG